MEIRRKQELYVRFQYAGDEGDRMVFSSLFFVYFFLAACFLCYYLCRSIKAKNIVLVIFSLIFYAWGEPVWVSMLLFSAFINWGASMLIGKFRGKKAGGFFAGAAIVIDLALLIVFKYSGFIVENINALLHTSVPVPQIVMPIGISFFTFQAISYIMDCLWETVAPQKKFGKFLLYLSLFPQLVAGPIVRYSVIEKEIENRKATPVDISEGAMRAIIGLSKKVIIANNLYAVVEQFFGSDISGLSFLGTWYGVILYSLYVYFDFSGYSDIAIGLGRMFGFHFNENFNYPFICKTISEFWQRWHISLSSFFRDYLFYAPIFGRPRKYFNLFLVWFCTGLWHGASWNFIFWGLYFGIFIFIETLIGKKRLKKWNKIWTHIYSKLIIIIGFGIFYFTDLSQLGQFFVNISGAGMILNGQSFGDVVTYNSLMNNLFLIIFAIVVSMPILPKIKYVFNEWGNNKLLAFGKVGGSLVCCALLVICSILMVDNTNNPFLYFRF